MYAEKPNHSFFKEKQRDSTCSCCNSTKEIELFPIVQRHGKWVIGSWCYSCARENKNKGYQKHREKRLQSAKLYNQREDIKDKVSKYHKKWRNENKDLVKKLKKEYYENNKKSIYLKQKEYNSKEENKIKINQYKKEYIKNKRDNDINFKILSSLRNRLKNILKLKKADKKDRCLNLLGCTLGYFLSHLESKFLPGMTWENYGQYKDDGTTTWHIDHIKPCNLFDLTLEEEQRKCFHYTNMQPLWAIDNLKKSDNFPAPLQFPRPQ